MLRSLTTGRIYNEVINKTIMLRENMNRFCDHLVIKATNKREEAWEKELENR